LHVGYLGLAILPAFVFILGVAPDGFFTIRIPAFIAGETFVSETLRSSAMFMGALRIPLLATPIRFRTLLASPVTTVFAALQFFVAGPAKFPTFGSILSVAPDGYFPIGIPAIIVFEPCGWISPRSSPMYMGPLRIPPLA